MNRKLHNLRARVYRALLKQLEAERLTVTSRVLLAAFDRSGVSFPYKGDEVLWLWPWFDRRNGAFVSICCGGRFHSLKELDDFWQRYVEAVATELDADFPATPSACQ